MGLGLLKRALQFGKLSPSWHLILILYNIIQVMCLCCLSGNMKSRSIVSSLGDTVALVFHGLESNDAE